MLRVVANENFNTADNFLNQSIGGEVPVLRYNIQKLLFSIFLALCCAGFGETVGVKCQDVAAFQADFMFFKRLGKLFASFQTNCQCLLAAGKNS